MDQVTTLATPDVRPMVPVELTVYAFQVPNTDEVLFAIGDGKGSGKKLPPGVTRKGNTLEFKAVGGTLNMELDDQTDDFKLEFRTADPIWSAIGTDCPSTSGNAWLPKVSCSKHRLSITNAGGQNSYGFALWFVSKNGRPDQCFDPIIKNIL